MLTAVRVGRPTGLLFEPVGSKAELGGPGRRATLPAIEHGLGDEMSAIQTPQVPPLGTTAFDGLGGSFRGELLLPTSPGYDAARAVWNGAIDRRPA